MNLIDAGIKAVAFDLFGTLVQITEPRHPYAKLLKSLGTASDQATANKRFIMSSDLGLTGIADALGGDISSEVFGEIERDLSAELASIQCFPDSLDVLSELRRQGIKIGIASNLAQPYAAPVKALLPSLDVSVWSFEVGAVKPESEFFRHVIRGFGCTADEILMVGDNAKNDVGGARAIGMHALCINRGGQPQKNELASLRDLFV